MYWKSINKNKYGAQKTGNGFPSKFEAAVYNLLLAREKLGELSNIQREQTVVLQDGPQNVRITWRIDFSYLDTKTNETVYVEAKGLETREYKIKLKLYRKNPPAKLEIYKGSYQYPKLHEIIELR